MRSFVDIASLIWPAVSALVPLDDDAVDVELRPFLDPEHDPQVAFGRALGARSDLDPEEALVLVLLADGLLGLLDLDRVVEHADPDGGLLPELVVAELRVPLEADLAEERSLDDDEDHAHPALELLGANLHVVEEPQAEDGADVVAERGRGERIADLGLHAVQDGRPLDPAVPLDHDVPDGRDRRERLGRRRLLRPPGAGKHQQSDQHREKDRPPRPGPPLRAPPGESQGHSSGERGPGGQRSARLSVGSETGSKMSPSPWTRTSIWTPSWTRPAMMDSASGSSMCFWMMRRSCRAP